MLFIIDHTHTAQTCPGGKINKDEDFAKKVDEALTKSGLKVIEGYLDGPGHHFYFVVEAESPKQIFEFSGPTLIPIGETRVVPVLKWSEAMAEGRRMGMLK